jgi:sulfatase-like protein
VEPEGKGVRRPLLVAGLHLAALWSVAVAEPLFDLMHKNPDFLAARGMDGRDIVIFALILALGPPLVLLAVEAVVGLAGEAPRRLVHVIFVASLIGLIVIQALKKVGPDPTVVLIALAAGVGVALAVLYDRREGLRSFLTALSPAPLVFLGLFLLTAPVSDLVFAQDVKVSGAHVSGDVPVVMVVFDEVATPALEDGRQRIDPVLFPNFASFARDANWFRYATAPTDETSTAVPALLTGSLPPKRHQQPILSKYPHNLFTFLGRSYRMEVSQEASDMCPRSACRELTRGSRGSRERDLAADTGLVYLHVIAPPHVERDLPSVSETLGGFGSDKGKTKVAGAQPAKTTGRAPVLHELAGGRPERFERVVDAVSPSRRPTLYFKHSLLPHVPFQYLPSGRRYRSQPHDAIAGLTAAPAWDNDYLNQQAYQRHLLQMQFSDRLLGTMLRRLREDRVYDKALIVVTADNGESFLHRFNRHEAVPPNAEDIAATPLLIKAPGQKRGRIVDRHVRTIDVLPTIADLLHVRLPWKVDGRSAWRADSGIPQAVDLYQRSGNRIRLSMPEFKRRVRASVDRKVRVFGSDGNGPGLFHFGPAAELIGRPLAGLSVSRGATSAEVNDAGAYKRVDLQSGFVPAQITGTISGRQQPGRSLAFAVNGRIVATAPSFRLEGSGKEQFSVVVSDRDFHEGRNTVQVLWVRRGGPSPTVESLAKAG